jgi:hypothetical protein
MNIKEFIAKWKLGIESIPPAKQLQIQIRSSRISLFGVACGIVTNIIILKKMWYTWWILLVLGAAFFNGLMVLISQIQKQKQLKMYDSILLNAEEEKIEEVFKNDE